VPLLLFVALLGYLAGHGRSHGPVPERLHSASVANVVLDYPSGWREVSGAPGIPGLAIANPIVLGPGGRSTHAGLLVGSLPRGELSPLPAQFVASLPRLPETDVVNLLEVQAYRYAQLSVPGFNRTLTMFVIPNPGGDATVLACYAAASHADDMRACEQTVATVTLIGQSQTYELAPEPSYARKISASISSLDGLRLALRRELPPQATAATVQTVAARLAGGFANAAASLSLIEPSLGAGQAQIELSGAVQRAHDAYIALASAAGQEDVSAYAAARRQAGEAESGVNLALENFVLLGYGPQSGASGGSEA
jgi:hypothetical protein